jgi:hypothetical protein
VTTLPESLVSGEIARLIPVIADSRKEQRATSVFLAALSSVPDFAQPLLSAVGVRLGKRSIVDTYTEVVLKGENAAKDRPDGLIVVTTGRKSWSALVEAKIGSAPLQDEQVQRYLQLARNNRIDSVITVSNQFVARPMHSPVNASKTLTRRVGMFHWSWKFILTEAILLQSREAVTNSDQAFILREFIRFLSHDSIGVTGFESMPAEWRDAVTLVKSGGSIRKTSDVADALVSAWHQETRDLSLRLSQHLATNVALRIARSHANDADKRFKDDCASLSESSKLEAEYVVPNAASNLMVCVDLGKQTISAGMEVDAPKDRQRGTARVNWLLRQLKEAEGDRLFVRIVWPSRAQDTICRLTDLRNDPGVIVGNAALPPKSFEVFLLSDDGRRFAGRKTFIEELERIVPEFYDHIGQHLERWVPRPPKPVKDDESDQTSRTDTEVATERSAESTPPIDRSGLRPGNLHTALVEIPSFLRRASD